MVRPSFFATAGHSSAWERLESRRVLVRVVFSVGGWARTTTFLPVSHQIPTLGLVIGPGAVGGDAGITVRYGFFASSWYGLPCL